ncbi:MAG: hypothetical protein FJ295_06025 [Planctomycetes bacterium]|nr:hypothetical protein [Planctomycetota bacterium]
MLQNEFIAVAIDQAYQRRQQDAEGEFYRQIARQSPRNNFENTTQGFYVATAGGELLLFNNNRDPQKLRDLLRKKLAEFKRSAAASATVGALEAGKLDARFNPRPPEGGLVVRVRAKVLDGYEPTDDAFKAIFQSALSRDNLWISKAEHEAMLRGSIPDALQRRIAQFHLVDNTRGEPPMWTPEEVRHLAMRLEGGQIRGSVRMETEDGKRGFEAEMFGEFEAEGATIRRWDLVVRGEFWGDGPFTRGAPAGRFPLAIAFSLADGSDAADAIPPQASRGWPQGYLR